MNFGFDTECFCTVGTVRPLKPALGKSTQSFFNLKLNANGVKAPADKGMDGRPTVSVLPRVTAVSTASLRVFA